MSDTYRRKRRRSGPGPTVDAASLAAAVARAAADKLAEHIVILDLQGRSPVTDYFVVVTVKNPRQQSAVAEAVADAARELGCRPYGSEGKGEARWTLLDFVDVVVHVFDTEWRKLYDLELLWGDAPRLDWREEGPKADG